MHWTAILISAAISKNPLRRSFPDVIFGEGGRGGGGGGGTYGQSFGDKIHSSTHGIDLEITVFVTAKAIHSYEDLTLIAWSPIICGKLAIKWDKWLTYMYM